MHKYLFVLSPPYSGSTVVWRLLATSPVVSAHPVEGQLLEGVKHIMHEGRWDPEVKFPWAEIKARWEEVWDMSKPVLLEKSPPAIVRAFDIEQAFVPSYFIAIIRDPYAFCEGRRRRYGGDMKTCAQIWVRHASFQMRNVQGLKNITYFRYEDFADNPAAIKDQILNFMPDLKDIDVKQSFNARSVRGRADRTIRNFNSEKIDRLSGRDIREANIVLRQNGQVMDYFHYEYLKPSVAHAIRYFKAVGAAKALNRISNKAMRTWTHRANHKH